MSPQYVGQLLNENETVKQVLVDDENEDGLNLNEVYIKSRTELTKTQNIKLQRQLAIEAGQLIRRDYLEELLKALLRHYESQKDWIRKNRPGDSDLLDTHGAMLTATMKECERRGWVEGGDIDAIE